MTDRDPDLQRQMDLAADELARRLRPYGMLADPHAFAVRYIEDLHEHGWWPHPRSDTIPQPVRTDPETYRRGGQYARELLQARLRGEPPE